MTGRSIENKVSKMTVMELESRIKFIMSKYGDRICNKVACIIHFDYFADNPIHSDIFTERLRKYDIDFEPELFSVDDLKAALVEFGLTARRADIRKKRPKCHHDSDIHKGSSYGGKKNPVTRIEPYRYCGNRSDLPALY